MPPELVAARLQASGPLDSGRSGATLADTVEDLAEHLAELFDESPQDRVVDGLEQRPRRSKPSGPHPPEPPARSVAVATFVEYDRWLLSRLTSFQCLDPIIEKRRFELVEFMTSSPSSGFVPWNGGPTQIAADCSKLDVAPSDSAPIIRYVAAIEESSSELLDERLRDRAAELVGRSKPEAVVDPALQDVLAKVPRRESPFVLARRIVEAGQLPELLEKVSPEMRERLTVHFIVRYGRSAAGGRHHMFKRETLVDWLAHAPASLVAWVRRLGDRHLADEIERGLAGQGK